MTSSISSKQGGGDTSGTARGTCNYIGAIVAGAGALADWCWYGSVSSAGVAYVLPAYRQSTAKSLICARATRCIFQAGNLLPRLDH